MIDHVIVMAAGRGERMGELTRTRTKSMLPVLGKPMVARVMDAFYDVGIRRFTIVVGEMQGDMAGWLSRKWHPDVDLVFLPQGHQRGTASALIAARDVVDGPFIITAVDNLIPDVHVARICSYFETHPSDVAVLSLLYAPDEVAASSGVLLDPRGSVMYISEKPTDAHQDYMTAIAVYGFTPRVMDYLDKTPVTHGGERVLTTAIQAMIDDGLPVGHVVTEWRIHLTRPQDLFDVNMRYLSELGDEASLMSEILPGVKIIPPVHIDPGVTIGPNVTLGPKVYLEKGSVIDTGASLRYSIVLGGRVGAWKEITGQIVAEEKP